MRGRGIHRQVCGVDGIKTGKWSNFPLHEFFLMSIFWKSDVAIQSKNFCSFSCFVPGIKLTSLSFPGRGCTTELHPLHQSKNFEPSYFVAQNIQTKLNMSPLIFLNDTCFRDRATCQAISVGQTFIEILFFNAPVQWKRNYTSVTNKETFRGSDYLQCCKTNHQLS